MAVKLDTTSVARRNPPPTRAACRLSVIIITYNEGHDIEACLQSVHFADEIIVLDCGSTDDTPAICERYTEAVHRTDWPGFGAQKQRALVRARGEWVLSIDADERVPAALKREILQAIQRPDVEGWEIPRLSRYCGRILRYGGWHPDYCLRLFRRDCSHFTPDLVHERVVVAGRVDRLTQPLDHYPVRDLSEVLQKIDRYSLLGAQAMSNQGIRSGPGKAMLKAFWSFLRTWILKGSILDGQTGLLLAVSNAECTWYKYIRLWMLDNAAKNAHEKFCRKRDQPREL